MPTTKPIKRALISTSDKSGLVEFAKQLVELGIEIIATGGTASLLAESNIPITEVADYTGFPEIMDGRVKSLHPKIHGGLLGRRGVDDDVMAEHGILPIDLVVVNLYPFQQTIYDPECTLKKALEHIDVGGPTMLRAAAKNFPDVTVLVDPQDYQWIFEEMKSHEGSTTFETRHTLAQKTFSHLANYDKAIAEYLAKDDKPLSSELFPKDFEPHYQKKTELRYGENPHQQAAFYRSIPSQPNSLAQAKQWQGKELSFNNLMDADCALSCVRIFSSQIPCCVIVKHATPCGVAQGKSQLDSYNKAYTSDPTSAFGGIIAFNTPLEANTAEKIVAQQFVEVLIAPSITNDAFVHLRTKPNIRVLTCGQLAQAIHSFTLHSISGGLLLQQSDTQLLNPNELRIVTRREPTHSELENLLFAWDVVKFVKSNAIVYAKDCTTLGIGCGQTSRVFAARIAALKAKESNLSLEGAVMSSDAFFPFSDSIDLAASLGITAIIQPGGSKRDPEVIAAADNTNIAMLFTGIRHFRH